jgi:xanthine dehydrogenase accessory factor
VNGTAVLREVWPFVDAQHQVGQPVVLARLVGRDGPGARPIGATMAVAADGTWRGSLSGGCVEGIVLTHARAVLDGAPACLLPVSPGEHLMAWEATPACTGDLQVLITPAPPEPVHSLITAALAQDRPLTVSVALERPHGWSVSTGRNDGRRHNGFVERLQPRQRLLLVGATDLAATIAVMSVALDRRVVVIDPRLGHLASGAFPATAELVHAWPDDWLERHPLDGSDALVALSHDPRIDDRALRSALPGAAGYVAALGSRATHVQRLHRLAGVPGLGRLAGPAGLDLGGAALAETALSILAELVAVRNGRAGQPLRGGHRSIRTNVPAGASTPANAHRARSGRGSPTA